MRARFVEQTAFLVLMGVLFAWAAVEASSFPDRARIFPQVTAGAALLLTVLALIRDLRAGDEEEGYRGTPFHRTLRSGARFLLWIGAYYLGLWLAGFLPATIVFVPSFLAVEGDVHPLRAVLATVPLLGVLLLLRWVLDLAWPEGVAGPIPGL